jgi:hypothetical protein
MVKALVNISAVANRVLNLIKAKYGLNDKSEAINKMAEEYEAQILEPELRPEFIEETLKIEKESGIEVDNFAKRYGLE